MGIKNNALLFYGIEFTYNQVKHIKDLEEVAECAEDIGCNDMPNIWSEFGLHYACAYWYECPDEHFSYIIGEEIRGDLTLEELIQKIDKEKISADIKKDCERFKLQYQEPMIICRPHVS
jgi:hypothetical protein